MSDSRNPADEVGAIVFRPEVDPKMRYDSERNIVVDDRNGDYMAYQIGDIRDGEFTFRIVDAKDTSAIYFPSRRFGEKRPDGTIALQYEVRVARTGLGTERRVLYSDKIGLERLARYINANEFLSPYGDAVVIDNREKNRAATTVTGVKTPN